MKRLVLGMSNGRKEIGYELTRSTKQVVEHLMKILLFPDSENLSHWKSEIYAFYHDVDSLKGSHKFPSYDFIMKFTWNIHKTEIHKFHKLIIANYGKPSNSLDDITIAAAIRHYLSYCAIELSEEGTVTKADSYHEIDNLIENYCR